MAHAPMCVCLQGGAVAGTKQAKQPLPTSDKSHTIRGTTAQFDDPFYTPIRHLQILGPDSDHPKLKRFRSASHGIPFSLFGPVYR
jgi:hypothetical protein